MYSSDARGSNPRRLRFRSRVGMHDRGTSRGHHMLLAPRKWAIFLALACLVNWATLVHAAFGPSYFISTAQLREAVANCLTAVPSGENCCSTGGANCGPAGNVDMPDWDVSQVADMRGLFADITLESVVVPQPTVDTRSFNVDISAWDVSLVTRMDSMFNFAKAFNADLSGWDTSSVENMTTMFGSASAFKGGISGWDVSNVRDMSFMFDRALEFSADLSSWDVSSVTTMWQMFHMAPAFNSDLSGWDVSSVTDMRSMFGSATAFNSDLSGWDVSSVTDDKRRAMFQGCAPITLVPNWYTDVCPAGHIGGNGQVCTACPAGASTRGRDQAATCTPCSPGESTLGKTSSPTCTACSQGEFAAASGSPSCTACAAGQWSGTTGSDTCFACAAGESTLGETGATVCTACAAGESAGAAGTPACTRCPAGWSTLNTTRSATCTSCAAGESTRGETGSATCTACSSGEATGVTGSATCTPCIAGESTLGSTGATMCTACDAGQSTRGETGSAICPPCAAGHSTRGVGGAASCTICPEGEWQGLTGKPDCIACSQPDWCPGGSSCAEGRRGDACFECAKNWYSREDVCHPCKQDALFFLSIFLGTFLFVMFIAVVVFPDKMKAAWKRLRRAEKKVEARLENIQKKALNARSPSKFGAVVFLVSLITFLQIQSLVVTVAVPWPSAVTEFFEALGNIVNLDVWGFIDPKCSFNPGFTVNWLVRLFSPLLMLLVVAVGILFTFRKSGDDHTVNGVVRLVVQVLHVTFVGNVVHALQPLDCAEYACVSSEDFCPSSLKYRVMESNPSMVCTTTNPDYQPFLWCSAIGFSGYAVAYVIFIVYLLWRVNTLARKHGDYVPSDTGVDNAVRKMLAAKGRPAGGSRMRSAAKALMAGNRLRSFAKSSDKGGDEKGWSLLRSAFLQKIPDEERLFAARRDTAGPAGAEEIELEVLDDTAGPVGINEIALEVLDDTAGPVTESFAGVAADKTGAEDPLDEDEEEEGQFERAVRGTHPDIQRLIRRYGLLFLPYSQRTWAWELIAMARKSLMALTSVFYSTTPILQLELMLAQNVSWLALLLWFRPYTVVPLMGGPLEKVLASRESFKIERRDLRWSPGNIVEIGMACAIVALNVIGLTIGDGDVTAQLVFFFGQLTVVAVLITRAVQTVGDQSVSFFGAHGERAWQTFSGL